MSPEAGSTGTPTPPSVRWIRSGRDLLHRRRGAALALLAAGFLFLSALSGLYTVENGESAAVLRFGRLHHDAVEPGLRFRWPQGIEEVLKARTGEISRLEIRRDEASGLSLLTGDENLIDADLVVQYRIGNLRDALFASESAEELLRQVVTATLVEAFAATHVDEVLTSAKTAIQNSVRSRAQERLDACRSGLVLVAVNLQSVNPPREAENAFRGVSDARAQAAQAINNAQGEKERALRLSRGEADRELSTSRATADNRRSEAAGSAQRFLSLLKQKRAAPRLTRIELYNQVIQQVLPNARLIVLAPGEPLRLELQELPIDDPDDAPVRIPPGRSMDDR